MRVLGLAAVAGAAMGAGNVLAVSLGKMADEARGDLELVSGFLAVVFYVVGLLIVCFGLLRGKKHVDAPQAVTLASAIVWVLVGVAIILMPAVINGVAETFGTSGSETVHKPSL